jgi:magnesium-transporting ATPase (P-type)
VISFSATYFDADVETVVALFKTSIDQGLTDNEVIARREHYGQNLLPKPKKKSVLVSRKKNPARSS